MKKIIASMLMIGTLGSFTTLSDNPNGSRIHSSKKLGLEIIRAAAEDSEEQFLALMPSVSDFHGIMNANAGLYGANLAEAKREFTLAYQTQVVPRAKEAFSNLMRQAKEYGIDWRNIEVTGIESSREPADALSFVTVSIKCLSKGRSFSLIVDKSLVWNGQWKISQYIRLVEG